jgi:transposase
MADPRQHRDPGPPTRRRGGRKGGADQALGGSRGGFGTELHIAVDGLGNPVEFILTGGQEADINQGEALIEGHDADAVIADKGYDGEDFVAAIEAKGAAVIAPKKNRIVKREYDKNLYKEGNLAERFIDRFEPYRRVATRYEKTGRLYPVRVQILAKCRVDGVLVGEGRGDVGGEPDDAEALAVALRVLAADHALERAEVVLGAEVIIRGRGPRGSSHPRGPFARDGSPPGR